MLRRCGASVVAPIASVSPPVRLFGTKKKRSRVYRTVTNDPYFNLAFEEYLFSKAHGPDAQDTMFLWRNKPSVIIGRNQNPYKECHVQKIEDAGVELVRRKSGGGAVYQDLGNSIFTFITPLAGTNSKNVTNANNEVLLKALESTFNIKAEASGRNDIVLKGQKISGAAFQHKEGRFLHHGTMLINVDFTALAGYLNPNKAKLASKGITSVQARVINLRTVHPEIHHDSWCDAMIAAFAAQRGVPVGDLEVHDVDHAVLGNSPDLVPLYEGLRDWQWRFGQTPSFTHQLEKRFDWGTMDVGVESANGVIEKVKIYSDSLYPRLVECLELALHGKQYNRAGIAQAAEEASAMLGPDAAPDLKNYIADFSAWLQREI